MTDAPATDTDRLDLSIVVPVYNSEDTLDDVARRTMSVLKPLTESFELVFVDDGSSDCSWDRLTALQAQYPGRVVAVQLMRNFGQHNALMCGLRQARGRLIVTMDDDLQTPPEEIPKLLARLEQGHYDVVYGQYRSKRHRLWRNLGSALVSSFYRVVFRSRVTVTSFRVIREEVVQHVLSYDLNFTYLDGLLAWNTQRIGTVEVEHHARRSGRSGYSLGKLVLLAMNLFTNFSLLPLQLVSGVGFLFALFGFLLGTYYLILSILDRVTVPGYASTIVSIFILGGTQLLALGVIGEYLGRLHLNVNRKPQYAVRTVLRHIDEEPQSPER